MKKIGRYDIVEELGRGGMGVVYKALDPTIGRLVALKVLSLASSSEPGASELPENFMREARAAGRLTHPAIVTIHDAFVDPETKSSCIVMELVSGQTLEKILLQGARLPLEKALDITRQVAQGLDYAHRQQVIHRDLKPANVLVSEEGQAKLTDFGIAKVIAQESAQRTAALMGTPSYMSPEQVTGKELDARSDLFSLGILFYLMLTGQRPFTGDTAAIMFKIAYEDPVPPSRLNPQLTRAHDFLALRLLAKDRAQRYVSAGEFLDDLSDVQTGRPPRSQASLPLQKLPAGELTLAVQPIMPRSPTSTARRAKWSFKQVAAIACAALLILGTGLGLGIWKLRWQGSSPPSAPPTAPVVWPKRAAPAARPEPAETSSAPTGPAPSNSSTVARTIQIRCQHDLKEATLSISSDGKPITVEKLKGGKKGSFFGLKHTYAGVFAKTITIPAGAQELSVRVVTPNGSLDLSKASAIPPDGSSATLLVSVKSNHLNLNWQPATRSSP
jgi:serine/threonine-protein kinase